MRALLIGCVMASLVAVEPAAAQEGWPWSAYPSARKQVGAAKRAPTPRAKTEPGKPEATASLDPEIGRAHV